MHPVQVLQVQSSPGFTTCLKRIIFREEPSSEDNFKTQNTTQKV